MDAAWKLGITDFDTADAYGGGRSETWIGRWMAARRRRPALTTMATTLAVFKPRGMTPYGQRKQREQSARAS